MPKPCAFAADILNASTVRYEGNMRSEIVCVFKWERGSSVKGKGTSSGVENEHRCLWETGMNNRRRGGQDLWTFASASFFFF